MKTIRLLAFLLYCLVTAAPAVTVTGNTSVPIPTLPGYAYKVLSAGTWDGATVTLQTKVDGAWVDIPSASHTADFETTRINGSGTEMQAVVTNAGGSTSLTVTLTEVSSGVQVGAGGEWGEITGTLSAQTDLQTALDAKVDDSQLSTIGGANKVPQFAVDGTLTTGTLLPDATPGTYSHAGAGNIIFPDARGLVGLTSEGTFLWNQYFSDAHDAGGGELYWSSRNRICFNWGGSASGDGGFQLGSVGRSKEWVYMQAHGTGTAGDPIRESKAFVWRGNHYNAGTPVNAWIGSQYVPASGTTGAVKFNHITGDVPHDANGRLNGTHVFSIADTGPVIPSGKSLTLSDGYVISTAADLTTGGGSGTVTSFSAGTTGFSVANATTTPTLSGTLIVANGGTGTTTGSITPTGDYTITQNSVPVIRSDSASAVTNTIRINNGQVRVGTSGVTAAAGVPFEVRTAADASVSATVGSFYVDSAGIVRAGCLSAAGGATSGRFVVQDRLGTAVFDCSAITATTSTSNVTTFSNATDSTSSTTGAVKLSGGMGVVKSIYSGANIAATGYLKMGNTTVGALTAAGTAGLGATMIVTDALAPVIGNAVAAGGSAKCIVTSNGTNWIVTSTL